MLSGKERLDYIDVAKALGMFAIYLGHFGEKAGYAYSWVFSWHVPLFFFLAGCMVHKEKERKLGEYILHKISTIMLPWIIFALFYTVVDILRSNDRSLVKNHLRVICRGQVRNDIWIGNALWFLTCLFIISCLFYLLRKIRNKIILVLVCVGINWMGRLIFTPHVLWNLDSVCQYIVFYCVGYISFPFMIKEKLIDSKWKKIACTGLALGVICYEGFLFVGVDLFSRVNFQITYYLKPLAGISLCLLCAYYFRNVKVLQEIGRNTLYLCGLEDVVKLLIPDILLMLGIELYLVNPVVAFVYTAFLLYVNDKFFVPVIKKGIERMTIKKRK